jgi:hypothetical protein
MKAGNAFFLGQNHFRICSKYRPNKILNDDMKKSFENMQSYNFACDFVWVRNLVSALREEHRLRVFENKVLRRTFGPKRDEVTGGWRKLHNEELRDLYSSPSLIRIMKARRMKWAWHIERMRRRGTRVTLSLVSREMQVFNSVYLAFHSYSRNSRTSHIPAFIVSSPVGLMPSGLKMVQNNSKLSIKLHYNSLLPLRNLCYSIIYNINHDIFLLILLSF